MKPQPLIICANCRGPVKHKNEHAEVGEPWTCTTAPEVHDELVEPMTAEQAALFAGARGGGKTAAFYKEQTGLDLHDTEAAARRQFLDALAARLELGARDYGNTSFDRPMASTIGELEDEALDIAGWAYVMWVQLKRRCARLDDASATLQSRPE